MLSALIYASRLVFQRKYSARSLPYLEQEEIDQWKWAKCVYGQLWDKFGESGSASCRAEREIHAKFIGPGVFVKDWTPKLLH